MKNVNTTHIDVMQYMPMRSFKISISQEPTHRGNLISGSEEDCDRSSRSSRVRNTDRSVISSIPGSAETDE